MFTFGSSYTWTGFDIYGEQPSVANPLGNPAYATLTGCNGPNWVDFLTTTYNASFLQTVNLAKRGAKVDDDIVPTPEGSFSLSEVIRDQFLPRYSTRPSYFPWASQNTLFASFMGMNDVGAVYTDPNATAILSASVAKYASLMDVLYQSGARNFLFINNPPTNRAPLTLVKKVRFQKLLASALADYNANITKMAANLTATYPDAKTFVFDQNNLYNQVLNNPCSQPETCPYVNTTAFCPAYEDGTAGDSYAFYPECGVSVDKYFWLNGVHPTFRIMNTTARLIAAQLSGG